MSENLSSWSTRIFRWYDLSLPNSNEQPLIDFDPEIKLLPASHFTLDQLTFAYNQTRIDYLIPMPMNSARLGAYVENYDIDMENSLVAVDGQHILGLGMLGVRDHRTWITRLGVLPARRRRGTGEAIMRGLLAGSIALKANYVVLEVIKGNTPAHELFRKLGFQETRELTVLRRPPAIPQSLPKGRCEWMTRDIVLELLKNYVQTKPYSNRLAWTNELETFLNTDDAAGIHINLGGIGKGWMAFRHQKSILTHFVINIESGDPVKIVKEILIHLYHRYPLLDTYIENLSIEDSYLITLQDMGFIEAFRRIEMELAL